MNQLEKNRIIEIKNLSKSIDDKIIFDNIHLDIFEGDRIFLRGKSGAGKSLLFRTIIGFENKNSGEIFWNNKKVSNENILEFRKKVIYLSQKPSFIKGSVLDNLKYIYQLKVNQSNTFNLDKVKFLLDFIEKDISFLDKNSQSLSGGESQLVAIIRALQTDPDILFLDESTSALDQENMYLFENLIDQWIKNKGKAYLWVSHNYEQINRLSLREIFLKEGKIIC